MQEILHIRLFVRIFECLYKYVIENSGKICTWNHIHAFLPAAILEIKNIPSNPTNREGGWYQCTLSFEKQRNNDLWMYRCTFQVIKQCVHWYDFYSVNFRLIIVPKHHTSCYHLTEHIENYVIFHTIFYRFYRTFFYVYQSYVNCSQCIQRACTHCTVC